MASPALKHILFGGHIGAPTQLPGLEAWYDTSDLSAMTVDSSFRVSLLADKSGRSAVNCLVSGAVTGNRCSLTTGTNIGTGDVTVSLTFRVPIVAVTAGLVSLCSSEASNNTARALTPEMRSNGAVWFTLIGATTNDTRRLEVAGFQAAYAGQIVTVTFTRTGTTVAAYVTVAGVTTPLVASETTAGTPPAWSDTITSTNTNIGFNANAEVFTGGMFRASVYSAVLDAAGIIANANGAKQASNVVFVDFTKQARMVTSFAADSGQTVTITTSGTTGARICGERDLYQGTVANQPVLLRWQGENYGYLNGVSGNYFSTPDGAALDITGDITLVARAMQFDWTPSAAQHLLSKFTTTGDQRSYRLAVHTDGTLLFGFSTAGTSGTAVAYNSTVATGFTDGAQGWVKVTRNGATGDVKFYTRASAADAWVQLGVTVSGSTTAMHSGTAPLVIGGHTLGVTEAPNGFVYYAEVQSGIDTAPVASFDASRYVSGSTFVAATGETWTLNGGATICTRTGLYFDGVNDYLKSAPFSLIQPETVYFVGSQVSWTNGDAILDGNATSGGRLYQDGTTPRVRLYAGNDTSQNAGWFLQTAALVAALINGEASGVRINRATAVTGNAGAGNLNGFTVGARGDGASDWSNITASEIASYSRAHGEQTQNRLADYFRRKHRLVF